MKLTAGQVWCWGTRDDGAVGSRLWLITKVFVNCGDSLDIRDALAIDLEEGEERNVFNLPAQGHEDDYALCCPSTVAWRRLL